MIWEMLAGATIMLFGVIIGAAIAIGSRDPRSNTTNPS